MLAQVSIFPTDQGESVGEHVARVVRLIADSGLAFRVTAMGTEIEGEPTEVFDLIKHCHLVMREHARRVYTTVSIDDRVGSVDRLNGKVESLERRLGRHL